MKIKRLVNEDWEEGRDGDRQVWLRMGAKEGMEQEPQMI